ncbi:MAG: DNA gyrase/topoisomerase IV subunit A [Flavobacteriales bacterium]
MSDKNTFVNNDLPKDISHINGMYKNWFLDYASYVILERSVPLIEDGLKPVQRRILHSLKDLDDGRFHKVANVVGHTMKYHPHGDASIYDAMVQVGQKNLILDLQGNWGNTLTGDSAAAARYIEVKLSKFALDVVYNSKITQYTPSYDGRGKEPVSLPIKFPLLLAQGVEGIAVGLSTKVLPHNFIELIDASIKVLKGVKPRIFPDFPNGGMADFSNYNDGKRGGKVRVRAKISVFDSKTLKISELPHGTTTVSLINSILKANDRGKIRIKKIDDNTSEVVEILVYLPPGISPDKTIDALYSFTDCEVSISPLGCVIENNKPHFMGVSEMLQVSTNHTLQLLKSELEINLKELQEKWHFSSLEKIFIENKIYRDIEECETWEAVIKAIDKGLKPFTSNLLRKVTEDDIVKLTEIKIKRISKFDSLKADEELLKLDEQIATITHHLANLVEYAIDFFKSIKKKYAEGRERKTEIKTFDNIIAAKVVAKNQKLYVNREEGFIGTSMRKDEFVCDCSDIDEIIVFRKDGKVVVTKVDKKTFVGKDIIHAAVFKKKDERTTYNMIYLNGLNKNSYMKRFQITSSTRDKEYDLTKNSKGQILYFTANPNGEAEKVTVHLRALQKLKKLRIDIDFSELAIKGKLSMGNLVSKTPIKRIDLKEEGVSTLSARKIWYDSTVNKLNVEERGRFLGDFESDDKIIVVHKSGNLQLLNFDLSRHFNDDILLIEKWKPQQALSAIYFDAIKKCYYVKRFLVADSDKASTIISDSKGSFLEIISSHPSPELKVSYAKERGKDRKEELISLVDFIAVKGVKAQGNKLSSNKINKLELIESVIEEETFDEKELIDEDKITKDDSKKSTTKVDIKNESINPESKIIIDEDSTDNQFKLEL